MLEVDQGNFLRLFQKVEESGVFFNLFYKDGIFLIIELENYILNEGSYRFFMSEDIINIVL